MVDNTYTLSWHADTAVAVLDAPCQVAGVGVYCYFRDHDVTVPAGIKAPDHATQLHQQVGRISSQYLACSPSVSVSLLPRLSPSIALSLSLSHSLPPSPSSGEQSRSTGKRSHMCTSLSVAGIALLESCTAGPKYQSSAQHTHTHTRLITVYLLVGRMSRNATATCRQWRSTVITHIQLD